MRKTPVDKHRETISDLLEQMGITSYTGNGSLNRLGTMFRDGKVGIIYENKEWWVIDGNIQSQSKQNKEVIL